MKLTSIALLIATVSAVKINSPNESYKAKIDNLAGGMSAIKNQTDFEATHIENHTAAMKNASESCETEKNDVRTARNKQLANGTYFPMKTYGAEEKAEGEEKKDESLAQKK